jgi:hypothetical protein
MDDCSSVQSSARSTSCTYRLIASPDVPDVGWATTPDPDPSLVSMTAGIDAKG